jgi:hypothetical protein
LDRVLKHDSSVPTKTSTSTTSSTTSGWSARRTVTEKLLETQEVLGGFSTIIVNKTTTATRPARTASLLVFATSRAERNKVLA